MAYVITVGVIILIVVAIVKAVSGDRYKNMTEEKFEAEARRSSKIGGAMIGLQRVFDPSHKVEYVQEQKQRIEADGVESGDRPQAGASRPNEGPGEQ
jgi:hypothetical protein